MMKTLKLALPVFMLLIGSLGVNAQEKIVTFGIKASAGISDFTARLDPQGLANTDPGFVYNVGTTLDIGFSPSIYLLTGLEFSSKKTIQIRKGRELNIDAMYLIVPMHFGYKLQIDDNPKFVFRAGPYVGYGIGGKTKMKKGDLKFDTFSADGFKKVDFGMGAAVGAEVGKMAIDLGVNFGLLDISEKKENVKTKDYYVSVGYKF